MMEINELVPEAKGQQVDPSSLYQAFLIAAGGAVVVTSLIRLFAVWLIDDITSDMDAFGWVSPILASVVVAGAAALGLFGLGRPVPKPFTAFTIVATVVFAASLVPVWTQFPNAAASVAATLMHIGAGFIIWRIMDRYPRQYW